MYGSRIGFLVLKNVGRCSCFQIGVINKSSLNKSLLVGENGVKYGTPKEDVDVIKHKWMKIPIAMPKNPAKAPSKIYINLKILKL